ncbi:MAG: RING finger domain-containing protein, partial [Candidatus Phytoplasma australasiaticum]|nr:RING finger domain-containing protein [Candidatus Phytoplasma australasiaticum]
FCDLSYNIVLVQQMLQYVIKFCLQKNKFDLDFFEKNIEPGLRCGHEFHEGCIKQWLLRKNDCPICRASVCPSE